MSNFLQASNNRRMTTTTRRSIDELVWACREESDMDKKVALYNQIRKALSYPPKLAAPSMITDDYINSALDNI